MHGCQPLPKRRGVTAMPPFSEIKLDKMNNKEYILSLIGAGEVEEALEVLKQTIEEKDDLHQIVIISSRFSRLQKERAMGVLRFDDVMVARNQIISSLVSIIRNSRLSEKIYPTSQYPPTSIKGFWGSMGGLIGAVGGVISNVVIHDNIFEKKASEKKLKAFVSYSHKDEVYRNDLEISLAQLKREGLIDTWSDRKILPGSNWRNEISENLEDSDVILLLVSPDFIASDYCYEIELQRAIVKHDTNESVLIPIILRHSAWTNSPIGNFQVLPREGKPITAWVDKDEAWLDTYKGIRNICLDFQNKKKSNGVVKADNKELKVLKKYKVGVFGETGTGKSTLCNSLLGSEVMRVSDIVPVTRGIQSSTLLSNTEYAIELQDFPGIGESIEGDKKFESIYEKAFEDTDIIVWILRADVRNYSLSQKYLDKALELSINKNKEFFVALSMVDRLGVPDDWDEENCSPRRVLLITIERKIMYISGVLGIPLDKIQPISGLKGYNVNILRSDILGHINKCHK